MYVVCMDSEIFRRFLLENCKGKRRVEALATGKNRIPDDVPVSRGKESGTA